ncbi:MAG: hypothetical protein ACLFWZ_01270 [Coleofasciculus sp.]
MPTLRYIKGFGDPNILILDSFFLSVCIGVAIVLIASRFQVYAKDRIPLPIADD